MSTSAVGEGHHPPHLRHRRTIIALTLVALVCLTAWAVGLPAATGVAHYAVSDSVPATAAGIEYRGDTANVVISPATDNRVSIRVSGTYSGARPTLSVREESGRTLVMINCYSEPTRVCDLDATITAPAERALVARTQQGALEVDRIDGPLVLRSESAPITLRRVSGPVMAYTLTGPVNGVDLRSPRVAVRSTGGSVTAAFSAAPKSVSVVTGNADVSVDVPVMAPAYRVSIETGG
ncbi:MAG: hypothetical protein ACSLE3_11590, partial [Microbacteriaceae bacterium]